MTNEESNRLLYVHEEAEKAFRKGKPKKAAKILCDEFKRLRDSSDFWNDLERTIKILSVQDNPAHQEKSLSSFVQLVMDETRVFDDSSIDPAEADPIIARVYELARRLPDMGLSNLHSLSEELQDFRAAFSLATDLLCQRSRGKIARALDYMVSDKGLNIAKALIVVEINGMAGLALLSAPAAAGLLFGAVPLKSIATGIRVGKGEISSLADIVKDALS